MAEKVVIIGSGPAGWAAAIYTSRAELKPLLFEGREALGQLNLTTEVENYPGFAGGNLEAYLDDAIDADFRQYMAPHTGHGISGPELMELMRQQAKNFGTRVESKEIVEVDFSSHPFKLKTHDGNTVEALSVIVSTGATANYLGLDSEEAYKNKGVSACAVCDGALPMFRNKPLVVVGGGDSAVEEATYLTKYGSKVYMIHRRDELRASKIMQQRAFDAPKLEIKWNQTVTEVLGDGKQVTGVKLKSTVDDTEETLEAGGMFLGIGHTPNTKFLNGALELTDEGYIKWTRPFRTYTSVEGVFAAGDVADDYYRQAVTAAGTGCMAALDAERWLAEKNLLD